MAQQYKVDKIDQLKHYFENNSNYIFNDYSGLSVEKITNLRKELRKCNSKFMVIKNNYIKRLLKEKNVSVVDNALEGPTAVTFVNNDINEAIKVLINFAKESTLKIKGGWTEGKFFDTKGIEELSKLPSRAELYAMLLRTLNAPVTNFVYSCKDVAGRLVRVLNAVAQGKKTV